MFTIIVINALTTARYIASVPTRAHAYMYTTPWAIKTCRFYFYDNFGKFGPISIILSRFEEKYLLLSGFTLEVVQISPANILYIIHI